MKKCIIAQRKICRKYVNIGVIISTQEIRLNLVFKKQFKKVKLSPQIDRIALMILIVPPMLVKFSSSEPPCASLNVETADNLLR